MNETVVNCNNIFKFDKKKQHKFDPFHYDKCLLIIMK